MSAHKHADLMALYAQDAKETKTPWERWEFKYTPAEEPWCTSPGHPSWSDDMEYRRKPQTSWERFNEAFPHKEYAAEVRLRMWEAWVEAEWQARDNSDE
jgi:hypothetical protein